MNVTLQIDDDVLARARVRALQQGTSVNALVRSYLASYAGPDDSEREARRRLTERAELLAADRHYGQRAWTREDLHQRGPG